MTVLHVPLRVGFSTADAEQPSIEFKGGDLIVQFKDWCERPVSIRFPETIAFTWQDEARLPADIRDDSAYEVINSPWVAELLELGATLVDRHHYKLCFNAAGVLDVVSGGLLLMM
jgi:hypothetical protein